MHQSGFAAMNPALDDLEPPEETKIGVNLSPGERSFSVIAGGIFLYAGLRRRSLPLILGGSALFYRGASGYSLVSNALDRLAGPQFGVQFEESITIHKPVTEVFSSWRQIENLPRFMSHVESVTPLDGRQSHWIARIPAPLRLEWDATITDEQEDRKIAWRSLPRSQVHHNGAVFFHSLPARDATEVKIIFSCKPPAGSVGAAVAELFAILTEHQLREDLRAFKAVIEAGEKPTIAGQPSGRF
ncbi:MAG: SRPBCC family protein [Candidatus Binatia bacterium]